MLTVRILKSVVAPAPEILVLEVPVNVTLQSLPAVLRSTVPALLKLPPMESKCVTAAEFATCKVAPDETVTSPATVTVETLAFSNSNNPLFTVKFPPIVNVLAVADVFK